MARVFSRPMGSIRTPLEERLRTIESMIEECDNELKVLRRDWLIKWEAKRGSQRFTTFDFFFENRERCVELGAVLAYLRLKRSECYDELEGVDSEMI